MQGITVNCIDKDETVAKSRYTPLLLHLSRSSIRQSPSSGVKNIKPLCSLSSSGFYRFFGNALLQSNEAWETVQCLPHMAVHSSSAYTDTHQTFGPCQWCYSVFRKHPFLGREAPYPDWRRRSLDHSWKDVAGLFVLVQLIGFLLLLTAFASMQLLGLPSGSRVNFVLNLVGASLLAVDALYDRQWAFLPSSADGPWFRSMPSSVSI